ncbi:MULTISPECIES: diguanylate cyclase domain-containing protein [unclassified Fusibacter]|uniref:diguanylate cyclase domain-containing protein n=1 Tax=unclassified Fusibacter TaxID=2624464 RepID=UPI001010C299|nr:MULTISPECIES: HD domain-containing phosphohydrolase [unclassified Fusibacter]MCK8060485.1 diguanylate cyclase [Fusibacter sp. A2]NPE20226.1 diguanylate cyclase [Fusibacter sp. A1]RXV63434.1 diguanylate cyclase [Fusibacter sp. A1]
MKVKYYIQLILIVLVFQNCIHAEPAVDFQSVFEDHGSIMMLIEPETGDIIYVNQAAVDFYRYGRDALLSMSVYELNALSEEQISAEIENAKKNEKNFFRFIHKINGGEVKYVEVYSYPIQYEGKEILFSIIHDIHDEVIREQHYDKKINFIMGVMIIGFVIQAGVVVLLFLFIRSRKKTLEALEISEKRYQELNRESEYKSYHDELTGLYNRRFFEIEVERLNRERNLPLTIIMGDLNALKLMNDAFGHRYGDEMIIAAADLLKSICRSDDILSRWGGDEFIFLLPKTDVESALLIKERIYSQCKEVFVHGIPVSFSLGICSKSIPQEDIVQIIQNAESKMYDEKLMKSMTVKNEIIDHITTLVLTKLPYQESHAQGVKDLAVRLGQSVGLENSEITQLSKLAMLHDIGLVGVDSGIIDKDEELNYDEWEAVKKHCEIGYRITSIHPDLAAIATEILYHHENFDGSGYPKGISGDEIPLHSRILRICDSYEVMVGGRRYQAAITTDQALKELKDLSGIHYDPDLVDAFLALKWHSK